MVASNPEKNWLGLLESIGGFPDFVLDLSTAARFRSLAAQVKKRISLIIQPDTGLATRRRSNIARGDIRQIASGEGRKATKGAILNAKGPSSQVGENKIGTTREEASTA
ncbi:uncharacterized protein PHALS_09720 [Plasmopara halstedii]|uniref:Uncharacterized protein n=1 Tax=Plasmopara halstedii TaxID=4781 RepID=A0A0N7L4S3_PLAHL|nr:uncharacterized protein PHALS_09720 [Plasmopara halstedii]CEG39475.1 hypothetical protein PHALS_09720 [Plasmopara halstedii]|eukprot:XP_024575844.1 hypothetical protein PHALS_09720 [Plasmopara halstedii]